MWVGMKLYEGRFAKRRKTRYVARAEHRDATKALRTGCHCVLSAATSAAVVTAPEKKTSIKYTTAMRQ